MSYKCRCCGVIILNCISKEKHQKIVNKETEKLIKVKIERDELKQKLEENK